VAEKYYIDGYNLMHKDPHCAALARDNLEMAREGLVERVARWASSSPVEVCVFFDGRGARAERHGGDPGRPGVEVVFTSAHLTADALIERDVYGVSNRHRAVVVTADQGIRDLCSGMGALTMRPEHFLGMMEAARGATRTPVAGTRAATLEDSLDASVRDDLLRLRDALADEDRGRR